MILDRHWWKTTDGRIVPDGHPDAAFLAFAKDHEIPDAIARRLGILVDDDVADLEPEPDPEVVDESTEDDEAKAKAAPANKARKTAADNKGA